MAYVDGSANSGAGVFDANMKCLLGVITQLATKNAAVEENGHFVDKQIPFAL